MSAIFNKAFLFHTSVQRGHDHGWFDLGCPVCELWPEGHLGQDLWVISKAPSLYSSDENEQSIR